MEAVIEELEERRRRHPSERFPVQHATASFHLGTALTEVERLEEAEEVLEDAVRGFEPGKLPLEHAKATNALGATRRLRGHLDAAADAFSRAAAAFAAAEARPEQGAAEFNLGLVRRDLGQPGPAVECFGRARALFGAAHAHAQVAAAARELGVTAFAAGELEPAERALDEAVALSARVGDEPSRGAAANTLGLVRLAAGRPDDAIEALREALAAHPRTLRAEGYAMVQANLALAYEQADRAPRARLAAHHALAVAGAPGPVRVQADGVLARLGGAPGDVLGVLDEEPAARWPVLVREEVARWGDAERAERHAEAGAWIDGLLAREDTAPDLAAAWVEALLELPPDTLEGVVVATVAALGERGAEAGTRFRSQVARAAARFHVPQLMRLTDIFNRVAAELGEEAAWG